MIVDSLFPPPENDLGTCQQVVCMDCKCTAETYTERGIALDQPLAACPECGEPMMWDPSGLRFGFKMGGKDFSSTKQGMRRSRSLTERNEKLKKKQWDNVEPMRLAEGIRPRNPTAQGPYDPGGPFTKRETNKVIISGINSAPKETPKIVTP